MVVTLDVVSYTDDCVSQDAKRCHQLLDLAIDLVEARVNLGVTLLLLLQVTLELRLLLQNKLHLPFEFFVAHWILSYRGNHPGSAR